jgi:dipeptidyl aminopeptidase/acylaminoacyl peptidase
MPVVAEDLFRLRLVGAPVADLERRRLYFVESCLNREDNRAESRLGFLDLDQAAESPEPRWLTAGPSDRQPRLAPDGRWLAFLSRRSGSDQVWLMPLTGGEPFQLTRIGGGVSDFVWRPDSQSLIVVAALRDGRLEPETDPGPKTPRERFTADIRVIRRQYHKLDGAGFFDDRWRQLVEVPVGGGGARVLTQDVAHHVTPAVSPDGRWVAFVANLRPDADSRPFPADLHRLDLRTGESESLTDGHVNVESPVWRPDGGALAFLGTRPEDLGYGNTRLYVVEPGRPVVSWSDALDRPLGDHTAGDTLAPSRSTLVWRRNGAVVAQVSTEGRVEVWEFDGQGPGRPLVRGDRVVTSLADGGSGDALALGWTDPVTPSALSWWEDGRERRWVWPTPWAPDDLARPVKIQARAPGGPPVDVWVLRHAPRRGGRMPAVLEVHGGPASLYADGFFFEFQLLAAAGWAVIYTNPRGSLGYGHAFCSAIIGQWGDKDYQDVMAGLDAALAADAHLDPDRVAILGGSYGGFMVNWAISHTDRFVAAVAMRSVVNRVSAMGTSDLGWLRIPQYGGARWWENPEPYWQQSPLRYASAIRTPLLLEHQEEDLRLPVEQAEQLFMVLKTLERDVTLVRYPGESHGMSRQGKPWHRVARLEMMVEWLRRYLNDEPDQFGR